MSGLTVLGEFYQPCLGASVQYDRVAGYFSSAALAVAARGVEGLVRNGGRMRLLASPILTESDFREIQRSCDGQALDHLVEARLAGFDPTSLSDELLRDHARAMLWMLKKGLLEIRLVVPVSDSAGGPEGLFHQKVGVFTDANGDSISFSGSVNETARAWTQNIENFKVFRSWVEGQSEYVSDDVELFDRYWFDLSDKAKTIDLPKAVRERLLEHAPSHLEIPTPLPKPPELASPSVVPARTTVPTLRSYQQDAVDKWMAADSTGILEMATGTGKTWVAITCALALFEESAKQLTVVAVPQKHLVRQWVRDLEKAFPGVPILEAHSDARGWEKKLDSGLADLTVGVRDHVIVATTHATAAGMLLGHLDNLDPGVDGVMLIGDECHGLGARKTRLALHTAYRQRLGLSATPDRLYDEEGTDALHDFFGDTVFKFDISSALSTLDPATGRTVLCPYEYHPKFVTMSGDELEEYVRLTEKIFQQLKYSQDDATPDEWLERFMFQRAKVVKRAEAKLLSLREILSELGPGVSQCLVYCLDSEQVRQVSQVLTDAGVVFTHFDGSDDLKTRRMILDNLAAKRIQAVVAMKCLDEGVDIPDARLGVILASSANPREFVQRRGRLLRQAEGKSHATVYDVAVLPNVGAFSDPVLKRLELRVFRREMERIHEFARHAMNAGRIYAGLLRIEQSLRDAGYGFLEVDHE